MTVTSAGAAAQQARDAHAATDLLCIAPHSDDAEIGCGATLRLLADRGRTVRVCDLTRGELATNATPDERWEEARAAAVELKLAGRVQLDLPDGFIAAADPSQVGAVVAVLRRLRPRWVVVAPDPTRHPDHVATPTLVERACFLARLVAYRANPAAERWWPQPPDLEPAASWRPEAWFTVCPENGRPDLIVDVSTTWEAKQRALACYASQFRPGPGRQATAINAPAFHARIEGRGRVWGARAGVAHGEALCTASVPLLTDLPGERWV
jgi:bacillithiol biosynthesis deacetylase BshB1